MTTWTWLNENVILAIHHEQLAEHGGQPGLRDLSLLESALARPINQADYGGTSAAKLAAAYAFGIAQNHPFIDGNKRTALVSMALFLELNGFELTASDASCLENFILLAEGSLSEGELAIWLSENISSI